MTWAKMSGLPHNHNHNRASKCALTLLFEHFKDKVESSIDFTLSATDDLLHQHPRSDTVESQLAGLWSRCINWDESFHVASHLQVFER